MKKYFVRLSFLVILVSIISSCEDNNSISPTGDDRDNFTGTWSCSENSKVYGPSSYNVSISKVGDADSVSISNFYNLGSGFNTYALISGNSLTIPSQKPDGIVRITGTGILSNSKINLTYYTVDGSIKDTVSAVYQ